jgi:hypothetical protein
MFDFNWHIAYDFWNGAEGTTAAREEAFKAGWLAALAQIIAMLEDERQQAEKSV